MRGCIYHDWPGGFIFSGDVAQSWDSKQVPSRKWLVVIDRSAKNTRDTEAEGKENTVKCMNQKGVNNLYC